MWNNGNGNGQGNGYGQTEDVYGRLNNTRDVGGARFPFMEGTGRYALCTLEEFMHSSDGPSARALFEVLESKDGKHPVGSYVVKIWKLVKPPFKPGMTTDADQFADFCRKLKGAPAGYPIGNDIRVLMKERPRDQLARGTVIDAVGVPNKKGTWINMYWNAVQQTPQDIAQMRQRLEQKGIPDTGGGPQQAPQQSGYTTANPAHAGYGPQANAPMYPQGAPHTVPQSGYPTANPAHAGYGMQQPAVQPVAAPLQGGFLAGVPTNNGGNNGQGGQGGWGGNNGGNTPF